jgi:hypothetical protein
MESADCPNEGGRPPVAGTVQLTNGESDDPARSMTDEQLISMLVDRTRSEGLQLTGEGGLLQQLTKRVLESALVVEITIISAMTSTTRPGRTVATAATAAAPRRW